MVNGLEESRKPNKWMCSDVRLENVVKWNQRQNIQNEASRPDVMQRQFGGIVDDQTSFEVPGPELDDNVDHVDQVAGDVRNKPDGVRKAADIRERFAGDTRPQVVQYCRCYALQIFCLIDNTKTSAFYRVCSLSTIS